MNIVGKVLIVNGHCGASVACRSPRTRFISTGVVHTRERFKKKKRKKKGKDESIEQWFRFTAHRAHTLPRIIPAPTPAYRPV